MQINNFQSNQFNQNFGVKLVRTPQLQSMLSDLKSVYSDLAVKHLVQHIEKHGKQGISLKVSSYTGDAVSFSVNNAQKTTEHVLGVNPEYQKNGFAHSFSPKAILAEFKKAVNKSI